MSKTELKKNAEDSAKYASLLSGLKYEVEEQADGYIYFQANDYYYRLDYDSYYISIYFGVATSISDENRLRALDTLNSTNRTFRAVKSALGEDVLELTCELWLTGDEDVAAAISRSIRVIDKAWEHISEELHDVLYED